MAKNQVIAGDHEGSFIYIRNNEAYLQTKEKRIFINQNTVTSYETVDSNYKKSAASAVGRAAVGAFLLGPVGLLAGVSAKNKGTHTMILCFANGKKSMIEVDDKINKAIITALF